MSVVGPRPEVPRYVAAYPPELRAKVLSVRPGITDPASLQFRDESTLLARAADPEREYREVVLPAKLRLAARLRRQGDAGGRPAPDRLDPAGLVEPAVSGCR